MTDTTKLRQSLISQLCEIRKNTEVIETSANLDLTNVENGVLIVYAAWSQQAVNNCVETIQTLYQQNYNVQIIVIDTDCMTADFQIKMLGQVCHGWGEIFVIRKGDIKEKYLGKDSFYKYKDHCDQ